MGTDLTVVNAARISFGSSTAELSDKDKKLIDYLATNEHMSPFEHNTLTVIVECPLYIRSQIMRHRTFSYNEVSRRYTDKDLEFYVPDTLRKQHASNRQASEGEINPQVAAILDYEIRLHHRQSLDFYERLIKAGVCREQARGVLPQDLMTSFYMTGNLRNWIHFVKLRVDKHAQYEVQLVGNQVLEVLKEKFPESTKVLLK